MYILQVIRNLQSNEEYRFADDVERIMTIAIRFRESYLDEKDKNVNLQVDVEKAVGRISEALRLSQTDQETIVRVKQELETSWRLADAAQARERNAQDELLVYENKYDELKKEFEKATGQVGEMDE